jgi:hypothetical protein
VFFAATPLSIVPNGGSTFRELGNSIDLQTIQIPADPFTFRNTVGSLSCLLMTRHRWVGCVKKLAMDSSLLFPVHRLEIL